MVIEREVAATGTWLMPMPALKLPMPGCGVPARPSASPASSSAPDQIPFQRGFQFAAAADTRKAEIACDRHGSLAPAEMKRAE